MASKVVQLVFVVLCAIGVMGAIICYALPEWAVGYSDNTEGHVGLWKLCVNYRTGLQRCETYDVYTTPFEMRPWRPLTIISCMFGVLSLLLMFFGSDFTTYVQNQDTKSKIILAAGVGLILAGLLLIIPVSWFSHLIRNEEGLKLGASVYIGFLSGLMLMLTGGGLCYVIRSGSSRSGAIISFFSNRA